MKTTKTTKVVVKKVAPKKMSPLKVKAIVLSEKIGAKMGKKGGMCKAKYK